MIPVAEGNAECRKCKHFDLCHGCITTYGDNWKEKLPPCGRGIIISQKELKEIIEKEKENGKRRIFNFMQRKGC